jgi:AcrR family transcriptional regulator
VSRREQAKDERRQRIIAAARDLIRETGDAGLSMRAIAARAGVSLSTPYNLFGSKRAILVAVLGDIEDFFERLAEMRVTDPIERIFQVLTLSIRYYADDPDFYRTLWSGMFDSSGKEVRAALALPERDAFWVGLLDAAKRDGALMPSIDTGQLMRDLDVTFAGVMLNWVLGAFDVNELEPAAGYGYALTLRGAAAPGRQDGLAERITGYQARLAALRAKAAAA